MKQKVSLEFPTLQDLWAFVQKAQVLSMEIFTPTKTLVCECTGIDVEIARDKYGAKLIHLQE